MSNKVETAFNSLQTAKGAKIDAKDAEDNDSIKSAKRLLRSRE